MKEKIIEVQIACWGATTLYMCCNEDDEYKYFICLNDSEYPVNKYIRIDKDDFKSKINKKNNFRDCYNATDGDEALFGIRRNIEEKKKNCHKIEIKN